MDSINYLKERTLKFMKLMIILINQLHVCSQYPDEYGCVASNLRAHGDVVFGGGGTAEI